MLIMSAQGREHCRLQLYSLPRISVGLSVLLMLVRGKRYMPQSAYEFEPTVGTTMQFSLF